MPSRDIWKDVKLIEKRYFRGINRFKKHLKSILTAYNDLSDILGAITAYTHSDQFNDIAHGEAMRMVESTAAHNARSWREAAAKSGKSRQIYETLRDEMQGSPTFNALVEENASLIKSVPSFVADRITKYVAQETIKGRRPADIAQDIRVFAPHLSESRALLIARTETAKAQSQITQTRAQSVGLNYYVWHGALDQRERKSHKIMEDVICDFRNPPAPEAILGIKSTLGHYNAGCAPNCRCFASPIIDATDANDIKNPRIVQGNKIVPISKRDLLRMF